MARWVGAATLDDPWEGELLAVTLEDENVVLCNKAPRDPRETVGGRNRTPPGRTLPSGGRL